MYKKTKNFSFSSTQFVPEINSIFEKYCIYFINEFEYNLFKKIGYVEIDSVSKKIEPLQKLTINFDDINFNEQLQNIIANEYLNRIEIPNYKFNNLSLEFSIEQSIEILDSILTYKMDNEMTQNLPIADLENDDIKTEIKPDNYISFNDFFKSYQEINEFNSYYVNFFNNNYLSEDNYKFYNDYTGRPLYFLLYRVRNNILKKIDERKYSYKTLTSFIKNINEDFKKLLYIKIINQNIESLKINNIEDIYNGIENEFINQLLLNFKIGKTFDEGEKTNQEISNLLNELEIQKNIETLLYNSFASLFNHYDEEKNRLWLQNYENLLLEKTNLIYEKYNIKKQNNCNINYLCDILRLNILSNILPEDNSSEYNNIESIINEAYKEISTNDKIQLIHINSEKYIKSSTFTVALQVKDLKSKNDILKINMVDNNIILLSHELFKSWQYNLITTINPSRPIIFETNSNKDTHIWVLVKNITCSNSDMDMAVKLAKKKLIEFLNMLYYFIANKEDINYQIDNSYIVFNEDEKIMNYKRDNINFGEPKELNDFNVELIKFINNYFSYPSIIKHSISDSINVYMKMLKSDSITEKFRLQVQLIKKLFTNYININDLSMISSIIIAGTNIDKENAYYRQMRLWLYEDFMELFYLSEKDSCVALKESILERFNVFSRKLISTILYNVQPQNNKNVDANMILDWILCLYKDNDLIRGEDND